MTTDRRNMFFLTICLAVPSQRTEGGLSSISYHLLPLTKPICTSSYVEYLKPKVFIWREEDFSKNGGKNRIQLLLQFPNRLNFPSFQGNLPFSDGNLPSLTANCRLTVGIRRIVPRAFFNISKVFAKCLKLGKTEILNSKTEIWNLGISNIWQTL
jgi:hypothetical protein